MYFNELLFAAMKRAYGEKLFRSNDKALVEFFARAEQKTRARIETMKTRFQSKVLISFHLLNSVIAGYTGCEEEKSEARWIQSSYGDTFRGHDPEGLEEL